MVRPRVHLGIRDDSPRLVRYEHLRALFPTL